MLASPRAFARARALLAAVLTTVVVASGLVLGASPASAVVPTVPANSSQVVVKTGGLRDAGTGTVGTLQGVALELRTASGNALTASCTSDGDGDCVFTVPNASLNSNGSSDFVVVQASAFAPGSTAAANYYANREFVTSSDGSTFNATTYRLAVDNLPQSTTRTVSAGGSNGSTTSGIWQNSYNNPPALQKCGLNIAVVSDLSYSVAISDSLDDLQTAARGFVNALAGTPSTVSLYTFGTVAPAPNTSAVLDKSTLNPTHVTQLLDAIDDYTISNQSYTNWDAALRQLNGKGYDQIVVITDGNPTRSGLPATGSSSNTRFVELENAIFSANTLKAQGSRIVTVGVGGASNFDDGQNLRAISGPTVGSDYFISGWSQLAAVLDDLARANCEGTVTVVKKVVPWDATGITGATTAGGWTFGAPQASTGTVTPSTSQVTKSNPGQGDDGTINYKLTDIPAGATFTVAEVQQAGYALLPQGSRNAVCVKNGSTAVTVTDAGALGFSIPVGKSDIVTCTVYNRAPKPVAELTVHKQWVVNGTPGTLDQFPQGFTAAATVGGSTAAWNTAIEVATGVVVVDEGTPGVPAPYCRVTGQHVTSFNGGAVGPIDIAGAGSYSTPALAVGSTNSVTITNTVVCDGQLTLVKNVENGTTGGTAAASAWTLTATPSTGSAISGTSGVSGAATPGTTYTLTESGGPAGYTLSGIVCATSATGPWTGPAVTTVTVGAQEHVYCRFTNTAVAPRLQLTKVVTGGVVAADRFALTATPTTGAAITGDGLAPYTAAVAGRAYTLTEAPVAGFDGSEFTGSAWVCTVTAGPGVGTTVGTGSAVTPALGQDIECVVTNTAKTVVPRFTKDAGTATADASDGTWDITYTLTATNPSAVLPLDYSLSDTPALPSGVQPVSAVVTRGAATVLSVPNWAGGALSVATGASIPAGGAAHVYTVTLTVAIPSTVSPTALDCATPGSGFDNSATLTPSTGAPITDTACVSVVPPTVTHDKAVTALTQDPATGRWTVVYDVTVTATGTGVARYDLTDALAFGTGVAVVSSSVAAGAGAPTPIAGWTGVSPNTALADEAVLAGGSSHVYTVTVVASVAAGVTGTDAADCALVAAETGTGFLNRASLTVGGSTTVATDCAEPVAPTLDKSFVSATQNADASWDVTFQVAVANTATLGDTSYSLSDLPGFASGVTITDRDVTLDGAPLAWDGIAALATDVVLPAGESDTYVLVFTVTIDPGMTPALRDCDASGAGHGFFNAATLTSGADTLTDDDCGPIAESVLPLVSKAVTAGYPRQLADGDWEIRYTVTVSTPAATSLSTRYDLDDTLAFGAGSTVVASSATGPAGVIAGWTGAAPNVELADDVLLPAGASHVYTVTVRAELVAGFVDSTDGDCTLTAGEAGTGFLNTATLRSGTATREAQDCASPARPTLDKSLVGAPVKNVDGTVTVAYTVTVANPSGLDLVYDLDDEIGFAVGVVIQSATATGPAGVTTDPAWTGLGATTRLVTAQALPAGATHVYTVEVLALPTLLIDDADLACQTATAGHGYFNGAELVSGTEVLTDDACAPIPDSDLPTLPLPPDLPTLALTGAPVGDGILSALALLVGGILLFGMRRRRVAAHRA
jgi:large repetitive protein